MSDIIPVRQLPEISGELNAQEKKEGLMPLCVAALTTSQVSS